MMTCQFLPWWAFGSNKFPHPNCASKGFNNKNKSYHKTPHKLHRIQKNTFQNGAFITVPTQNKHLRATGVMKYDTNPNFMHSFFQGKSLKNYPKTTSCCLFHLLLLSGMTSHDLLPGLLLPKPPGQKVIHSNPRRHTRPFHEANANLSQLDFLVTEVDGSMVRKDQWGYFTYLYMGVS